ncbi:hypothetical protein ELQ35_08190 [Peribacillus cavernae]|uniref:DUF5325 family protein n=1 Tax=Peribacillus cavernae TaxID=1674310 RepID=A0A3S1B879_9BACI|nr:YlaF family protein [Peribacillus cavernae]MDQ0217221.1 hypothetical protein [Peribacillus cavernae]RUQ30308.1 hypothetical protein ELQ35_08190 [Peribacillus cavernae]
MKNIQWNFLILALLATASLAWTGIAIGERSLIGIFLSILALFVIMGFGFATKKKMREKSKS